MPYSQTFLSSGGTEPYSWEVIAGSLPPGVALDGATGIASGNPTTAGDYPFTLQVTDADDNTATIDCSITVNPAGPPAVPPPGIGSATGVPFILRPGGCSEPNRWDRCLFEEMRKFEGIRLPPMCAMPEGFRHLLPWDDEHSAMPYQAVPFNKVSGLLTPAPAAGDQVVTTLTVPLGYDGFLTAAYWFYSGKGFVQGSGDILWRIQLNQRYVKDMSNNPYQIGSPQLPFPLTEGQLLLSGETARGIVNVPNLSGNINVGQSQIVMALIGFFWPRGGTRRYAEWRNRIGAQEN